MSKHNVRGTLITLKLVAVLLFTSFIVSVMLSADGRGANYRIICDDLDMNGGKSSSAHYTMQASAGGQSSAIGTGSSAQYRLMAGYVSATSVTHGDANNDATINISDAVYLIAYIFSGGPAPNPLLSGDANCDCKVNISDVVYLIAYIFSGGPAPCAGC